VQIMAAAMKQTPTSYLLLHTQSDFLRAKGRTDWALQLAQQAVNCAPSEFVTWEKLTELYIERAEYDSALLTLNSCPMFTFNGRDAHRALSAARLHMPVKPAVAVVLPERDKTEDDDADPALQRLPAPGLRGTWARAYTLLTRLVSQIGWDELLKTRSLVFVMEEEYRMQKAQAEIAAVSANGTGGGAEDDDASTRGLHSARSSAGLVADDAADGAGDSGTLAETEETAVEPDASGDPDALPTIRISTESAREEKAAVAAAREQEQEQEKRQNSLNDKAREAGLQQPVQAAQDDREDAEKDAPNGNGALPEPFSFSNKRLCERWLDNLFMVLYEVRPFFLKKSTRRACARAQLLLAQDLRVWTIFRAEVAHFKTQHVAYRKTGAEWEILGDLGLRLHHKEEAKEAYQRALEATRYAAKPWSRLLETYADEGDLTRTLQSGIRVAAYQHAEHADLVVRHLWFSLLSSLIVCCVPSLIVDRISGSFRRRLRVVSSSCSRSTGSKRSGTPCGRWASPIRYWLSCGATSTTARRSASRATTFRLT
jgi:hypothetical protein